MFYVCRTGASFHQPLPHAALPAICCISLLTGSVTGVGLEITYDGGSGKDVVVLTPSPGGPADKAGARAGDVIVAVDGTAVKGLSLYDVSDLLQGDADSQVCQMFGVRRAVLAACLPQGDGVHLHAGLHLWSLPVLSAQQSASARVCYEQCIER
jgi:hypothetical protein